MSTVAFAACVCWTPACCVQSQAAESKPRFVYFTVTGKAIVCTLHGRTGVGSPLPSARKDVTLVGYFRDFCNGDISLVARLQPTCYTYDPRCTMPCYTYDSFQSYSIICRLPCPLQRLALPIGCLLKVTRLGPKGHHRFRICIPQSLAHVVAYIGNI